MLSEFVIVCLTVFHEGSICDDAEMRAIARTIQVRAKDQGKSYKEICLAPNQYSCWNGKNKLRILELHTSGKLLQTPAWRRTVKVVREMFDGQLDCMTEWTHYYNPKSANPKWAWAMKDTKQFRYHIFGRIEG